jgi:ABC-type multidrug transport system, ATPase and permease components
MTKTKSKSLMTSVMTYGRAYILPVVLALVMAALGSIATIVGPGQISKITNLIAEGLRSQIDLTTIVRIVVGLAVIYGLGALLSYGQGYTMATVTQKFTQKLRTEISQKINRLPLSYFDEHNEGDTLSRVTNDLDTLAQSLNQSLGNLIASVLYWLGPLS